MNNIKDQENINQKIILLRLDLNVPLKNGVITDQTRIDKILPVINFLIKKNCKIIIISHVGRPKGKVNKDLSLKPICENLESKAYYLFPRSSISKTPLRLANSIGLIDGGYRGELVGMVDNIYDEDFHVKRGERYFQLVAVDSSPIDFELVEELSESSRGEGGFGSTGR